MKKQTVTMETIARAAGVSQSTVSLALNGRGRISPEVREQIGRIARDLGYELRVKTPTARSAHGSSLGVLLDRRFFEILDSYFIRILRGLQTEAENRGCRVIFATVGAEHLKSGWRSVLPANASPDGLVVVGVTDPEFIASFQDSSVPVVFAAAGVAGSMRFDTVTNDDAQGMQEALAHLKALGHRQIAFVGGGLQHLSSVNRLRAYKVHMDELFGAYDPNLIECAEEGAAQHAGFETCSALLAKHAAFTALVCMTDEMARGAVEALVWSGLRVPEDISVVGFDNKEIAQVINPPLTTVQINCEEMGRIACEVMMLRLTETSNLSPLRVQVAPELIVRSSTGPVLQGAPPWTRSRYGQQMARNGAQDA